MDVPFKKHRVIAITNGHFIHAGPLKETGVFIYLLSIYLDVPNETFILSFGLLNTL